MKYEDNVIRKIKFIDSVFNRFSVAGILSNNDFIICDDFHFVDYVKFRLIKNDCIKLELVVTYNSFQINLDRTNETFEWSEEQFNENVEEIESIIEIVFTSLVVVKYCGLNYTKIYFIDHTGFCVKTLKYITGFYLRINCKSVKYNPIYPRTKFVE